jgi:hypothetical protein
MKQGLAPAVAEKLAKVVGLLASDFDGERANAAAAATKLLRAHGMSWADLVTPGAAPAPRRPIGHRARALEALRHGLARTVWEVSFLHSVAGQEGRLSEKQEAVLRRIEERSG